MPGQFPTGMSFTLQNAAKVASEINQFLRANQKSNLSHTPPTVAGSHKKRKDYRANNPRNGIFSVAILLILIMDSARKISLSRLRKKTDKALCRKA
ncbi:hypothetical protein [Klebsiella aerogenes]|uniref:hypothetical protein n=1 Tax=Klebsiella aerogenes TaxID=548 RepID=UPI00163D1C1A|nr:hypothetical protein [Klebsiella aerogenes]